MNSLSINRIFTVLSCQVEVVKVYTCIGQAVLMVETRQVVVMLVPCQLVVELLLVVDLEMVVDL